MKVETKIDFIITWVDGSDPHWQEEKNKYDTDLSEDSREIRYRGLNNLKYWFRGVDKYAPWVNKIHFVTWGHLPKWLNVEHPKINIVKHEDFIPKEYLPTFSSHTIELNLHRIKGLSNHFVYFNDDTFIINPTQKSDFFIKELPLDSAIIRPNLSRFRFSTSAIDANNLEIINTTYTKNKVIMSSFFKWFNLKYQKHLLSTFLQLPYKQFSGFLNLHLPNGYLKDTFIQTWEREYSVLHTTCKNKFRNGRDVNQWIFRYIQLMEGNFIPRKPNIGRTYGLKNDNEEVLKALKESSYKMICINDNGIEYIEDFETEKRKINQVFNDKLPNKSKYEL